MDPNALGPVTMNDPGPINSGSAAPGPATSALQNALMLQAIKGGAGGGASPAMAPQAMAAPPGGIGTAPPMGNRITPPVDPSAMQGGLGQAQMQQAAMQQQMPGMMQQNNPVASALMSQIPGVQ